VQAPGDAQHGDVRRVTDDDGELVTAEPTNEILRPNRLEEPRRDPCQDLIACRVAEGVVDRLEAIDVAEQHRGPSARCAEDRVELLQDPPPVGQARQRVAHRRLGQLIERRLLLADVDDLPEHHRRAAHHDRRQAQLPVRDRPVLAHVAARVRSAAPRAEQERRRLFLDEGEVIGMEEVEHVPSDELVDRVAHEVGSGLVDAMQDSVDRGEGHPMRGVVERHRDLLGAMGQRSFGHDAVGHVAHGPEHADGAGAAGSHRQGDLDEPLIVAGVHLQDERLDRCSGNHPARRPDRLASARRMEVRPWERTDEVGRAGLPEEGRRSCVRPRDAPGHVERQQAVGQLLEQVDDLTGLQADVVRRPVAPS